MRSSFVPYRAPMADPEPSPGPTPFPIQIVSDGLPPLPQLPDPGLTETDGKRSDCFYPAWNKFLAQETKRAKSTSRAAARIDQVKETVEKTAGDGLATRENATMSYEQAAAECKAKVDAIVDECVQLNQKYRDMLFDLEANPYTILKLDGDYPDSSETPPWVKRVEDIFEKPEFFIDGASAYDVHQGGDGDCWFLAALMAVSAKKELIEKLCVARNEKVGVYGFVFFRDGEWIYEVIDDKLYLRVGDDERLNIVRDWSPWANGGLAASYDQDKIRILLQKGGEALFYSHCKSNETWLPLIEKAYAKAHGDYSSIEGGDPSEGIEDLTGGVGIVLNPEDIMDKDRFWNEQLSQVNKKYLFGGGSKAMDTNKIVGNHAYAVLQAWEEGDLRLLKIRNPWGEMEWDRDWSDGSKQWTADMILKLNHTFGDDGVFWMSYKDFMKHFPSMNRVRLFDDTWSVAQQWTSVNVPWTVDYLDTKFQFDVTEKGPVVVVLCQPDDRYFMGLRGRYVYSLHFRVYKSGGGSRWIVRSMHNSGSLSQSTRSVSVEVENLEPGTYDVVFKVTAIRQYGPTAEDNILKYALIRKEKLLSVGRRFDYAQSKGDLRGLESANRKARKLKGRNKEKVQWKKDRKLNQKENERARKRQKRIDDAIRKNQREYNKKLKEREKRKQERKEKSQPQPEAGEEESRKTDETETTSQTIMTPAIGEEQQSISKEPQVGGEEQQPTADDQPLEALSLKQPNPDTDKTSTEGLSELTVNITALNISPAHGTDTNGSDPKVAATSKVIDLVNEEDDDDDSEPPLDPPIVDFDDDDFDWDSDMDGPLASSPSKPNNDDDSDDDGDSSAETGKQNGSGPSPQNGGFDQKDSSGKELFADDPWNAMLVLGLRVYSKSAETKVRVVKAEENEEDVEYEEES